MVVRSVRAKALQEPKVRHLMTNYFLFRAQELAQAERTETGRVDPPAGGRAQTQ